MAFITLKSKDFLNLRDSMGYFKMISLALGKMLISPEKKSKIGKLETSIADKSEDLNICWKPHHIVL